jgi:mono/diheme cytochrome c family protein/glucose/arabinose dehydrogenase
MANSKVPGSFFKLLLISLVSTRSGTAFAKPPKTQTPTATIAYLTPEEEARTFVCEDGYRLELAVSDPVIKEPVLTVFDGNGRMFVAEMRSFMQDINGTGERATNGRVSVHWSSKHDGVYDKHAVFADNLVLPRMVLPLANWILINETDTDDYYLYQDSKGDGVADKKVVLRKGGRRGGNLEHQPGGMIWDMDNWIYSSMNPFRLRFKNGELIYDAIIPDGGQWGLCQDDYGKPWPMNAGYEAGPVSFQAPFRYGATLFPDQSPPEYSVVWPLIGLPDMEGGTNRFRPVEKSLNHFTSTCGSDIYRGSRLPADLRGDHLLCEPVGRLIRRTKIEVKEGFTTLHNAYEAKHSEFIRSTDPNFRPVNITEGPDGAIYITDMYRGLIQEREWVGTNTYLHGVVKKYNLDKNVGRGRIWRVVHDPFQPNPEPRLLDETPGELVTHLQSTDGWWRDTAQQLLVLKDDKSVVPKLISMARADTNHLARIHALWTLEGLDALTPEFTREKLRDAHPQVRIAAIRASEDFYLKNDHSLLPDVTALTRDPDPNVVIQVLLSANLLKWPGFQELINQTLAANPARGVKKICGELSTTFFDSSIPANPSNPGQKFSAAESDLYSRGRIIYRQLCFICHALDGKGTPYGGAKPSAALAPPLAGSPTVAGYPDALISVVLKGLTGPVNGKHYDAQMIPMENNDDQWIAAVLSYIRNNFGNHSTFITAADVARVRAATANHPWPWTLMELREITPQNLTNRSEWKLTASQNPGSLDAARDGNINTAYDSRQTQAPGQWVQIELPGRTELAGLETDTGTSQGDYPRGYQVQLSDDGINWGKPVAEGNSSAVKNQILFPPANARFIRITLTAADPEASWAIAELQVLAPPPRSPHPRPAMIPQPTETKSPYAVK